MQVASLLLLVACCLGLVHSTVYTFSPSDANWFSTITTGLKPGDVVNLNGGTYTINSRFSAQWQGTAAQPITIQGVGSTPVTFVQTSGQNGMDIADSYHFTLSNIQVTLGGASASGSCKGIRLGPAAVHDAVFDSITIHDVTATAFSANDGGTTYYNITLQHSTIKNTGSSTGECVYVGCESNGCTIHDSVINNNFCYNTLDANGGSEGSAFQVKTGSYNNIISNNVCDKVKSVCVLAYDDFGKGKNIIEGNLVLSAGDHGIQVTAGAIIRNNIIVKAALSGIGILDNDNQNGQPSRDITVEYNTIYGVSEACIRQNDGSGKNIIVANNALFCESKPVAVGNGASVMTFVNNFGTGTSPPSAGFTAVTSVNDEVQGASSNNFYPKSTSKLIKAASTQYTVSNDYNGLPRSSTPTVGAYEYSSSANPAAIPSSNIKTFPAGATTGSGPSSASKCAFASLFVICAVLFALL